MTFEQTQDEKTSLVTIGKKHSKRGNRKPKGHKARDGCVQQERPISQGLRNLLSLRWDTVGGN